MRATGSGTYRVLVFDPANAATEKCKPWNTVKRTLQVTAPTATITFPPFDSLLTCGGAKAYCIAKEADSATSTHFCSGELTASYQ